MREYTGYKVTDEFARRVMERLLFDVQYSMYSLPIAQPNQRCSHGN